MRDKQAKGGASGAASLPVHGETPGVPPGVAALASRLKHVPSDSELMMLPALADAYRLLYEQLHGMRNCAPSQAGKFVVDALLGDVPEVNAKGLKVFRVYASGPAELQADDALHDGTVYPSERRKALQDLGLPLIYGNALSEIAQGRSLAVLRAEAITAFRLKPSAADETHLHRGASGGNAWPVHDWRRWGTAALDDGQGLRRVADVVALRCDERTSIARAVQAVLAELRQALPSCAGWYLLQPGKDPDPLDDSDIWEPSMPHFHGREPDSYPEWQVTSTRHHKAWRFFVREPNFPGLDGVMECLKSTMQHARSIEELNAGIAGRIAIPEPIACAVARVGKPVHPVEHEAPEAAEQATEAVSVAAALVPTVRAVELPPANRAAARADRERQAGAEFKRTKEPGAKWTAADLAELLRQHRVLTASGAGSLLCKNSHTLLSERWGLSVNSVKTYLTKAREAQAASKPKRYG